MFLFICLRACLHGGGGHQVGEVTRLAVVEKLNAFTCNLTTPGAGVRFCKVDVTLAIREFKCRRPKLKSRERGEISSRTCKLCIYS